MEKILHSHAKSIIKKTDSGSVTEDLLGTNKNFFAPTSDVVLSHGEGIYLYDTSGRSYIDCGSATFNLSLGYSHEEVLEEVVQQSRSLVHATSSFMTKAIANLTEQLVKITPGNLDKIHLKVSSGSVANEGAIKMAQHFHKGKREVVSFFYSHLGQTVYMMGASGNSFRSEPFQFPHAGILKVPAPHCYRCFYGKTPDSCNTECATKIPEFIKYASANQVCAVIVEPIFGNGENIVPTHSFFKELKAICEEHDISLIFDEIQTGVGRTGEFFAAQHFGVSPNIMTIAKGLGGTGFQVAAIACEDKYTGMDPMHHSFTYGSNVMAASAGAKTLEIIQRPGFLQNVKTTGQLLTSYLKSAQLKYPFIGDVRGVGLMIGFEIVDKKGNPDIEMTKKIQDEAFKSGVILRSSLYGRGSVLKIRPPLIITVQQATELCERIENTFSKVFK